jgi:hypothetical protein
LLLFFSVYEHGDVKIQGLDGATNVFVKNVSLKKPILKVFFLNSFSYLLLFCLTINSDKLIKTIFVFSLLLQRLCVLAEFIVSSNFKLLQGDLDVQVSHVRAESRLHVEEGDIHLRLSDAHPLKVTVVKVVNVAVVTVVVMIVDVNVVVVVVVLTVVVNVIFVTVVVVTSKRGIHPPQAV